MPENAAIVDWLESLPAVGADSEADGWVSMVNRGLAHGDSTVWTDGTTESVKALQEAAGLESSGVISGKSWALVMPVFGLGDLNTWVGQLHNVLGVGRGNWYDKALAEALGTERLDRKGWLALVGLEMDGITYAETQEVRPQIARKAVADFPGAEDVTSGAEEDEVTLPVADQEQKVTHAALVDAEGNVTEVNLDTVPLEWSRQTDQD